MARDFALGVDLGGTNVRLALYRGLSHGGAPEMVEHHRQLVGDSRAPDTVADNVAAQVRRLLDRHGLSVHEVPIGIGIAAMLCARKGVVANAPNLHWRDVAFATMVSERLEREQPVGLYNDVNAITFGEWAAGSGAGVDDVLAVFVGTGVGGGFIAGGRLIEGGSRTAGEIGHIKVVLGDTARSCGCGMRGCIEAYVGGTHLQARIRRELASGAASLALELAGGDPDAVHPGHLDEAANRDDRYALERYDELAPLLAAALGNAISLLNPSRLILGGGVLSRTPVFRRRVQAALEQVVNPVLLDPLTIVAPALGDDAGLVGSALWAADDCRRRR